MKLILKRIKKGQGFTEGELWQVKDDGTPQWIADTLEPQWRNLRGGEAKIMGQTAIPEGSYNVLPCFSSKFKRQMPYITGIPNFSGVMFHPGNSVVDTQGCILVGKRISEGLLFRSREKFAELEALIKKASATDTMALLVV